MALNIHNLETSFDVIAPRGEEVVEDFYHRLFTAAPALRALFPDDMKRQRTMLLAALVLLRKSLRDLDRIAPTLRSLGARHVGYGALPEHYPVVGSLLIESMTHVAGDAWRPDYTTAWAAAFDVVAGEMMAGAEEFLAQQHEERLAA
jgi:hemoglobin-like flavoprotein